MPPAVLAGADTPHVECHSRIGPLVREWDELADRTAAMPWVRPGWILAWRRAFGRGRLHLLVARRDGRLCGVLPLERRFGELRSPTNPQTPGFGLLAEDGSTRRTLAAALLHRRPRGIDLRYLPVGAAGLEETAEVLERAGYRLLRRTIARPPLLSTDGDWESYRQTLGARKLRELRRRRRLLERRGRLWLDLQDGQHGSRGLESLLAEGLRVEALGWKGAAGTAMGSSQATRRFYRDVAGWAATRGALRLAYLRLDERALAFDYCLEERGTHYLLKTGYDPAFRQYGPGMLLRYLMLERAFRSDLETYEFLGTNSSWKLEWTDRTTETVLLHAFAPSVLGRADHAAWVYGRPAARRLLRRGSR